MKIYSSQLNYYEEIKKAEAGDVDSMIRVAFAILHGNKNQKREPEETERALRYYNAAIAAGNKSAMLDLAACYMDGRGVERDVERSMQLYEQGFDPNDPGACFCLGAINRYDYTEAQEEKPTADQERIQKAIAYFQRGVDLESSDCMYELGEMYMHGIGVDKSETRAYELFSDADCFRDPDILSDRALRILLRLAECNHYGIGTEIDIEEAYHYICDFREELRRRADAGETEEQWVTDSADQEWGSINRAWYADGTQEE